jgi:hypothetical protein
MKKFSRFIAQNFSLNSIHSLRLYKKVSHANEDISSRNVDIECEDVMNIFQVDEPVKLCFAWISLSSTI